MAPQLDHLEAWVGEWETEATHPMLPDLVVPGRITVEWLEARSSSSTARAPITSTSPGSISAIGDSVEGADSLTMPYFDSRGVFRVYRLSAADGELKIWRDHPWFSPALHRPLR